MRVLSRLDGRKWSSSLAVNVTLESTTTRSPLPFFDSGNHKPYFAQNPSHSMSKARTVLRGMAGTAHEQGHSSSGCLCRSTILFHMSLRSLVSGVMFSIRRAFHTLQFCVQRISRTKIYGFMAIG